MWRAPYLLALAALFLWGCASAPQRPTQLKETEPVASNSVEPPARTLFFQAERAFQDREYDKALEGFHNVRTKHPRSRNAVMMSTYRMGSIYYLQENYRNASREFESYLNRFPGTDLSFDVRYNLAAAEYQMGNHERAYQVISALKMAEIRSQGARRAEVVYQLAALSASQVGNHPGAIVSLANLNQLPIEESRREQNLDKIDSHLAAITNGSTLDRLLMEVNDPTVRGRITQRMNALVEVATAAMAPPVTGTGDSPEGLPLRGSSRSDRTNVGIILPLSGEMARYGERALEGILLAAGTFQAKRDVDLRFFIEDSQSNPDVARRAVDTLYNRDNVVGILGPLAWNEAVAVGDRAQQLGILNLSLTGKEGLSARGAYLFQNALTPRVQLESLVQHCLKERSFKRFAILAPNNGFGRDMANEFLDLVEAGGGRVSAFKLYPPGEKDFQEYVQQMVGLGDPKARSFERTKLAEFKKEVKEKTGREPKAELPPIIDFDAIFLPDSPSTVSQIAASLAYFDVSGVPLLGTTEWNSPELYKRGGRYVEGALFPGGLSANTSNELQRDFMRTFAAAYGSAPDLLSTQAYESLWILMAGLKETSSSDRNDIVREISRLDGFKSPLGSLTFDGTRIARRKLSVFKLESGGAISEQ